MPEGQKADLLHTGNPARRSADLREHTLCYLPLFDGSCTICRLKETRLLDAAHIVPDVDPGGEPRISNGLSICSIHHRARDDGLIGVSPDYVVQVHPRLLDEEDGPMLAVLNEAHGTGIVLPKRAEWRPDRELLARRFEQFQRVG